jgi:glycosyltransferase involved in cell wall biosynthesis
VACVSAATRRAVLAHGLIAEERLHLVPNGIPDDFTAGPDPAADAAAAALLGAPAAADPGGPVELLHVGTTIPRKRIDVLLRVVAAIRRAEPSARLVKAGGALTPEQAALARALGLGGAIVAVGPVGRPTLAALYRRAALVLQPSESEGFGLPVAEALACGAAVLASDLEVLREVGGACVTYAPVADVPAWADAALALLEARRRDPAAWAARRAEGIARAARYRWSAHVERLVAIYQGVLA